MKHPFKKIFLVQDSLGEPIYVHRPILPVSIQLDTRKVRTNALIDTGSDFSIFDTGLARVLGINLEGRAPAVEFSGVGGAIVAGYEEDVVLGIGEEKANTTIFFAEGVSGQGYGLLGIHGFFDTHTVKFYLNEGYFVIEPTRKLS